MKYDKVLKCNGNVGAVKRQMEGFIYYNLRRDEPELVFHFPAEDTTEAEFDKIGSGYILMFTKASGDRYGFAKIDTETGYFVTPTQMDIYEADPHKHGRSIL